MGLTVFWMATSSLYLVIMGKLADEVRDLSPKQRREAQSVPMMLAITAFYGALLTRVPVLLNCFTVV